MEGDARRSARLRSREKYVSEFSKWLRSRRVRSFRAEAVFVPEPKEIVQMNRRQRRKMGLTFVGVLRALKNGKWSQEDLEAADPTELALEVMGDLIQANPQAWENIDWDRVLEILVKFLEIILKYLPLFLAFL